MIVKHKMNLFVDLILRKLDQKPRNT